MLSACLIQLLPANNCVECRNTNRCSSPNLSFASSFILCILHHNVAFCITQTMYCTVPSVRCAAPSLCYAVPSLFCAVSSLCCAVPSLFCAVLSILRHIITVFRRTITVLRRTVTVFVPYCHFWAVPSLCCAVSYLPLAAMPARLYRRYLVTGFVFVRGLGASNQSLRGRGFESHRCHHL